jgi:hypothetical protein
MSTMSDSTSLDQRAVAYALLVSSPSLAAYCRDALADLLELSWRASAEASPEYLGPAALVAARAQKSAFLRHWLAGPELKDQLTPLMRECANLSHADMTALVASLRPEVEKEPASSEPPPATAAQ